MSDLNSELDAIEAGMMAMHRAGFQHKAWEMLQRDFDIKIDRSSATLLKAVAMCKDKPCRMQDIARYLGIEAPSVTRTVHALVSDGLLARHLDKDDRRASIIGLTTDGSALLRRLQAAKRARLKNALRDWPAKDRQDLARLLNQLADAYSTLNTNN
jgi:DNA-binding MarR family transcriptional regulator